MNGGIGDERNQQSATVCHRFIVSQRL